ncbi:unnamed protein product [Phaeothamnion confervicola]
MRVCLVAPLLAAANGCIVNLDKVGGLRYTLWSVSSARINSSQDAPLLTGGTWTTGKGQDQFDLAQGCYGVESYSALGADGKTGSDPTAATYSVSSPDDCMNPPTLEGDGFSSGYFAVSGGFCGLPECFDGCWQDDVAASAKTTDKCANYQQLLVGSACKSCADLAGQRRVMQTDCLNAGCDAADDCGVSSAKDVSTVYNIAVSLLMDKARIGEPVYDYALKRLVEIAVAETAGVDPDLVDLKFVNGRSAVDVVDNMVHKFRTLDDTAPNDPFAAFDLVIVLSTEAEANAAATSLQNGEKVLEAALQQTAARFGLADATVSALTTTVASTSALPVLEDDSTDGDWPAEGSDEEPNWSTDSATTSGDNDDCADDDAAGCACAPGDTECEENKKSAKGSGSDSNDGGFGTMNIALIAAGVGFAAVVVAAIAMKKRRTRALGQPQKAGGA